MSEYFWWCNRCRSRVDDLHVTFEEYHDGCGGTVIAVKEEPECPSCAAKDAEIERLRGGVSVEFQSAVSGLWYTKRGAAGDVSAIKVDGELFKMVNAVEAVPVEELETLRNHWLLDFHSRPCAHELKQLIDQAREASDE